MRRRLVSLTAGQDGEQRVSLRGVGALVEDRLHLALPLIDRTGPGVEEHEAKPVELCVAETA